MLILEEIPILSLLWNFWFLFSIFFTYSYILKCFPSKFSSSYFKFKLTSLIYFELLLCRVRKTYLIKFFCRGFSDLNSTIFWITCFFPVHIFYMTAKISWSQLSWITTGSSILFHWFTRLFIHWNKWLSLSLWVTV